MSSFIIIEILDYCKSNDKIINVEFIERRKEAYVKKLSEIGEKYSSDFNLGITNIWSNGSSVYSDTTPEIFYSSYGFKYFSKQVMLRGGPPKEIKEFNSRTCKYEVMSPIKVQDLKNNFGSKYLEVLACLNLNKINSRIKKFENMSNTKIKLELISLGFNFQI